MQGLVIKETEHIKYLDVTTNKHLSFNEHINRIAHKANSVKSFLQRNIKTCPTSVKENCYKIMVRSVMEYACTVCSPHTKKNIQTLETVQRRAARFIKNDYANTSSVTAMLQELELPTLEERRWAIKATMVFKILHNIVCIPADNYYTPITDTRNIRHHQRVKQYASFHVNTFMNSFFPLSINIWNKLPNDVVSTATITDFKNRLTHDLFNSYCNL